MGLKEQAVHRYRQQKIQEQINECNIDHTEDDVREAARYLQLEHMLPEPRQEFLDFNY